MVVEFWRVLRALATVSAVFVTGTSVSAQGNTPRPIRHTQTIADSERDGGDYLLTSIHSVNVSSRGDVYLLDRKEANVKLFTADGRFVRTFARRGVGPGELTGPSFRARIVDSQYVITDHMLRRDVHFSLDGRHLRTVAHPAGGDDAAPTNRVRTAGGGQLDVTITSMTIDMRKGSRWNLHRHVLYRRGDRGTFDTLAHIRSDLVVAKRSIAGGAAMPGLESSALGDGGAWALSDDTTLALIDGYSGSIRWLSLTGGTPRVIRTAQLPGPSVSTKRSDFDSLQRAVERRYQKRSPRTKVELSELPPRRSLASDALFANDGALWVGAPATSQGTLWTVFPANGATFTVRVPRGERLSAVARDRLYTIATNDDDVPLVRVYEFRR